MTEAEHKPSKAAEMNVKSYFRHWSLWTSQTRTPLHILLHFKDCGWKDLKDGKRQEVAKENAYAEKIFQILDDNTEQLWLLAYIWTVKM